MFAFPLPEVGTRERVLFAPNGGPRHCPFRAHSTSNGGGQVGEGGQAMGRPKGDVVGGVEVLRAHHQVKEAALVLGPWPKASFEGQVKGPMLCVCACA